MTPEQKKAIRAARAEGKGYNQISRELEVALSVVWRTCNPVRAAELEKARSHKKREWERKHYRGTCLYCGKKTGHRHMNRCQKCEVKQRGELTKLCLATVKAMYEEGWKVKEMSEAFGHKTPQGVGPWLADLRAEGKIGYRYPPDRVENMTKGLKEWRAG